MKQTEHYGLNQWDPEDRILREDFNADNDTTDTILAELDGELEQKLGRVKRLFRLPPSSPGPTSHVMLTVSQWAEGEFAAFTVEFQPEDASSDRSLEVQLGLSDQTFTIPVESAVFLFWPGHDLTRKVKGVILCPKPVVVSLDITFSEFRSFTLTAIGDGANVPAYDMSFLVMP